MTKTLAELAGLAGLAARNLAAADAFDVTQDASAHRKARRLRQKSTALATEVARGLADHGAALVGDDAGEGVVGPAIVQAVIQHKAQAAPLTGKPFRTEVVLVQLLVADVDLVDAFNNSPESEPILVGIMSKGDTTP